jgi:hypothetical protein
MKNKDILALWNSLGSDEGTMAQESFEAQIIKFYHVIRKETKREA